MKDVTRAAVGTFPYPMRTVAEVDRGARHCRLCGWESAEPCIYDKCPLGYPERQGRRDARAA